jgi:ABC-type molybdenum transport system ATPase subunit/photorepair protein PhrA
MKYRDVVQIPEPLEVVKQVRDSATEGKAKADVETFVISDRMASQLVDTLLPNLRFDEPGDNRGLFIVGTYGTGKTHLMSVIAAIAEFPGLLAEVRNEAVRDALAPVEGEFEVIRFDIGASTMSCRHRCTELTNGLSKRGVDFEFPPIDKVTG